MTVAYAGKPLSSAGWARAWTKSQTPKPRESRQVRAYEHFLLGRDTASIAEMMGALESTVLRWISVERSKRRGLPSPYECKE